MKILISLTLLLSVVNFANAQESETPVGSSLCSHSRQAVAPSTSSESESVEAEGSSSHGI